MSEAAPPPRLWARGEAAPGARAVGHWLPIAAVAGAAVLFGQSDMALTLLFSSSIAAIALVGGCVAIIGTTANEPEFFPEPLRKGGGVSPAGGRAGVSERIRWGDRMAELRSARLPGRDRSLRLVRPLRCEARGFGSASDGCRAAVRCGRMGGDSRRDAIESRHRLSALAHRGRHHPRPLLAAPMLLSGSMLAQRGQAWAAHGTHIGVAQTEPLRRSAAGGAAVANPPARAMAYPMHIWRVDAIVMVLLAAALLPATAGRWRPGRMEGFFLVGLYIAYVLAVVVVALR